MLFERYLYLLNGSVKSIYNRYWFGEDSIYNTNWFGDYLIVAINLYHHLHHSL